MTIPFFFSRQSPAVRASTRTLLSGMLTVLAACTALSAHAVQLADQPLFTSTSVPGNVALALSVEYPTAIRAAHTASTYTPNTEYLGYFDPNKCYSYNNAALDDFKYFIPRGRTTTRTCSGLWSGNFLNWATMQTVDPFRWALTGGYRKHDTAALTVLERAWQSGQDNSLSPDKSLPSSTIGGATPFGAFTQLNIRVANLGYKFRFTTNGDLNTGTATPFANLADGGTVFEAFARVQVCDATTANGGVETNCHQYGTAWKPEGLIQQYSNRMRFSAFGYLNESGNGRDGGVLRARQKFVGPTQPVPGQPDAANAAMEWDAATGIFRQNPDAGDASDTNTIFGPSVAVANSGVMNYLNKFGQITPGNYKSNDPVGELYYAAIRYFSNLGNVSEWSAMTANSATKTTLIDGFPVITNWDDPIQYSCQKNFVLGIGDVYTHGDRNVPGNTNTDYGAIPGAVSADTSVDAVTATNRLGVMQGMGASLGTASPINGCCGGNSALMAGLAYFANTQDIRPDVAGRPQTIGRQSVQTYWVDVLERAFEPNNQFYLAAKYGGFAVPANYDYTQTAALPTAWWATTADTVGSGTTSQQRPDNYFTAGRPDLMVSGLTRAFASIAAQLRAYTTSFSLSLPQVAQSGNASFSSQYDSGNWTGEVTGSEISFDGATGNPTDAQRWLASERLTAQFAGTGWNADRRVVTFNPTTGAGIPFRTANITTAQTAALDTSYRTSDDSSDYLNYLRGEKTYETGAANAADRFYRERARPLGDIVGSRTRPVGPPSLPLSNSANPGYAAFKTTWTARPTVVYVGANDGMLHALNGSVATADAQGGRELFAYIPSALFLGPDNQPNISGLAGLGSPDFTHHYYVNSTPTAYDIDLNRTDGTAADALPNWRSVLIGGLGKGGRSYYALDVTDPATMTTEGAVAGRVLWEFTHPHMGFTFGEPAVVKTRKYGWVVILPSGYNNATDRGYFFIVNPRTGALLEKIPASTDMTIPTAGLAHVNTFVNDRSDGTADSAYAGDLHGNVWRLDLRGTTGLYPAPTRVAVVTDTSNAVQPITSRPRIEIQRATGRRFILFGTGRLLDSVDISSTQQQSFYAVADGLSSQFNTSFAFPIRRANLTLNADPLVGLLDAPVTSMGWYIDLGRGSGNIAWRVISEPTTFSGIVAFAAILPNGNACNPAGVSRVYALNYGTGITALRNLEGVSIVAADMSGIVTDLQFFSVQGTPRLIAGTDLGEKRSLPGSFTQPTGMRRLNWRELRVVD
jgi:type IV pilus assembly protein PilY1